MDPTAKALDFFHGGQPIISSAPGKLILFGEHAVVHGKTAIATSIQLRTYALFEPRQDNKVVLDLPDLKLKCFWNTELLQSYKLSCTFDVEKPSECELSKLMDAIPIQELVSSQLRENQRNLKGCSSAILAFLYLYYVLLTPKRGINICVRSFLPTGMGLGSSAAFSVSITAGLLAVNAIIKNCIPHTKQELNLINDWAYQLEKIMHGTPSGIDNSVSTFGGTLTLTRGIETPIRHLERTPKLDFLLTNTKQTRDTSVLVKKVRDNLAEYPEEIKSILDRIHIISTECIQLFLESPSDEVLHSRLETLIDENQLLLCKIGVGHSSLDLICDITAKYGFHSKLTGAGGGGCSLTLLRNDTSASLVNAMKKELEEKGFDCFQAAIGGSGVLVQFPPEFSSFNTFFKSDQ